MRPQNSGVHGIIREIWNMQRGHIKAAHAGVMHVLSAFHKGFLCVLIKQNLERFPTCFLRPQETAHKATEFKKLAMLYMTAVSMTPLPAKGATIQAWSPNEI